MNHPLETTMLCHSDVFSSIEGENLPPRMGIHRSFQVDFPTTTRNCQARTQECQHWAQGRASLWRLEPPADCARLPVLDASALIGPPGRLGRCSYLSGQCYLFWRPSSAFLNHALARGTQLSYHKKRCVNVSPCWKLNARRTILVSPSLL